MKRKTGRAPKTGIKFFIFLVFLVLLVIAALDYTNKRVMPSVVRTMETLGENKSLRAIDGAVKAVVGRSGIKASDLYVKSIGPDGKLTSLSADTMLINSFCADVAEEVVQRLEETEEETIFLPLGIITGFDFLSTKGPKVFGVTVKPLGHCTVDYNTSFKSEGINQINYQIWLDIESKVTVVNPVISRNFSVERRLPVVNTYISGQVPDSMLFPFNTNLQQGNSAE